MEDGSLGLVGQVKWPKGKTPILQASKDVLATAGRVAASGIEANTYGQRIGKSIATSGVNSSARALEGEQRRLPIITVPAHFPFVIHLREGF